MKRDMELMREILLLAENEAGVNGKITSLRAGPDDKHTQDEIAYHIRLLGEAGFLEIADSMGNRPDICSLTWQGHDFLDAVRDPEIWRKTIDGADEVGSFTFDVLKSLASGFIKKTIKDKTGIEI